MAANVRTDTIIMRILVVKKYPNTHNIITVLEIAFNFWLYVIPSTGKNSSKYGCFNNILGSADQNGTESSLAVI